jgi:hypothetical protein
MAWYCGHCLMMNSDLDAYCCVCQRMKDNLASSDDGGLPSATTIIRFAISYTMPSKGQINTHHDCVHASESSYLDIDSADETSSAPAEDPDDGRRRKFWYCCYCGDGPHGVSSVPACPNCNSQHKKCTKCEEVLLKVMSLGPSD